MKSAQELLSIITNTTKGKENINDKKKSDTCTNTKETRPDNQQP